MKLSVILLLGVIFLALISSSVQSIYADHILRDGKGIFIDEYNLNTALSFEDSKYQINLHVIVRNAQDQLVSVSQVTHGYYLPHQLTDQMIDKMQPGDNLLKEIVIIDKMKYEKIQNTFYDVRVQDIMVLEKTKTSHQDIRITWYLGFDENIDGHGSKLLPIFQALAPVSLAEDDILTFYWTFLRELN